MGVQPNIYDSHWTRCNSGGYSPARIVNYLLRRPNDKDRPTREASWHTIPKEQQFGDARAFKEEANRRREERLLSARLRGKDIAQDHSPKNVQYLHVVISPSRRDEFGDEDFGALIVPWIRDKGGRVFEHFGAVHYDDREGPKLHLVVARDKFSKKDLLEAKERSDKICCERERLIDLDREPVRELERESEREPGRRLDRECEDAHGGERDGRDEHDRDFF